MEGRSKWPVSTGWVTTSRVGVMEGIYISLLKDINHDTIAYMTH